MFSTFYELTSSTFSGLTFLTFFRLTFPTFSGLTFPTFSGPLGASIRAVHGGKVVKTGGTRISDLGKVIIVKSDDGFEEIYQEFGGMKNIKVGVGDTIRTGQKIATLGTLVGAGSGPHVHIGVTKGNPLHKNMLSTSGWYDVTKMHGSHISKKAKKSYEWTY